MTKTSEQSRAARLAGMLAGHASEASPYEIFVARGGDVANGGAPPVRLLGHGQILAAENDGAGTFRAVVSRYDVKYRIGYALHHTIEPGAFDDDLADNATRAVFWMHGWSYFDGEYSAPIGDADHATDTDENGLVADGRIYIVHGSCARVHEAMVAGAINEWSIGYQPMEIRLDEDDDFHEFVIKSGLLESSSVLRGANPETETLEVAAPAAAGAPDVPATATVEMPDGTVITSASPELIKDILAGAAPAVPGTPPPTPNDLSGLPWSAQRKIREIFGS